LVDWGGLMKASIKITLIYVLAGIIWIIWSNELVEYLFSSYGKDMVNAIKYIDGGIYVLFTGILLFFLIQRQYRYLGDKVKELENVNQILKEERVKSQHAKKQLDQFILVASHDLADPVRQSHGFLNLFISKNEGKLPRKSIEFLQLTLDNFLKIQNVISDLATFSQLSENYNKKELVNLNEVFQKIRHLNSKKFQEGDIKLKVEPLPKVPGDYKRFIQLFDHLILNAIKYKEATRPLEIEVTFSEVNDFYTIEIKDNGRGIPTENLESIFYILKRYDYGFIKRGSGMGLAITRKIVEGFGGKIWANSTLRKGSIFYIKLKKELSPSV
jgi:light-regulated signal transduction histidine kinase (bacteriophytochrome)